MKLHLNPSSIDDYNRFLAIKRLPRYAFSGRTADVPDEYARLLGAVPAPVPRAAYSPSPWCFDYQAGVVDLAVTKEKFAIFADCGLGKSMMFLEYATAILPTLAPGQAALIVTPLMVVEQFREEARKFYGSALPIEVVASGDVDAWLQSGTGSIGITNWEALTEDLRPGRLAALLLDESSLLKSMYGAWGQAAIRLGRGLRWKLCGTGTPAPNDRIEYANHAVFLDQYPTTNAFLARFFVNRGQTDNRWELKPHALGPFYRSLSHWSIFLTDPATYGWKDNCGSLPPISVHVHDVDLTEEQQGLVQDLTGGIFATSAGGITSRGKLAQIAKGHVNGVDVPTLKPAFIRDLAAGWPSESTIIWCKYNEEQAALAALFPEAANITGATPYDERLRLLNDFKAGRRRQLITKPKILGFGQNLQICTRMVFSTVHDSYEEYYQAIKRANRYGSTRGLNVHLPVTQVERPMMENVLRKAARVEADTRGQEALFRRNLCVAA